MPDTLRAPSSPLSPSSPSPRKTHASKKRGTKGTTDKTASALAIGPPKFHQKAQHGSGLTARFCSRGLQPGYILQQVVLQENDSAPITFTECWGVSKPKSGKGVRIEQQGDDAFYVPYTRRTESGTMSITASAWYISKKEGKSFGAMGLKKNHSLDSIAGSLWHTVGEVDRKYQREPSVMRRATFTWEPSESDASFSPICNYAVERNGGAGT